MNFGRVVRMAIRYKLIFAASIVSALAVAVLWGANVSAVYPFVQVGLFGQSPHQWITTRIERGQAVVEEEAAKLKKIELQLAAASGDQRRVLTSEKIFVEGRLKIESKSLKSYQTLQPYILAYLPSDPFVMITLVIGFLIAGTLVKDVFLVANNVLVSRLAEQATFDLRKLFYRRTLRMDLSMFSEEGTADLMSRFTNDMNRVAIGLEALFGKLIREPLKMVVCLCAAGWICWRLLLLTMVIAPLAGYLVGWLAKSLKRANRRAMEEMAAIYATLEETFRSIKIVKAFTNEPRERKRFHDNNKGYFKKAMRIAGYDALTHPMTEVLGIVPISMAMLAGAWMVLSQSTHLLGVRMTSQPLDWAELLSFYALLAATADPLRKMSDVFSRLQAASAASDRIFARLDRQPKVRDPHTPVPFRRHHRELVFENVGFAYQPGKPVLEGINLQIGFGETVALVGSNGCGKSTLANLVPRFADPTSGEVKLDGVPLRDMRIRDVRRQIGLVTQETMLFDETIFNNIRYGAPDATREQVIAAAKQAHAHRFIETELPNGYETSAGALGNCLSGGQRQRIALARAILRDPSILILDEATSQVDLESEQAIQQVLETFTRNRTTILITHRLAVLSLADRIVVMQGGKILDVGRHEELLAHCAFYRRLYQIQFEDLRQTA
ncbi:MAG: ABC transporter ATP-binding protein/permease [Planctomycetaceae bacterium]|nr:ABC transporter ATP-binding protein/permease [Planctomycetaceae bacterium]